MSERIEVVVGAAAHAALAGSPHSCWRIAATRTIVAAGQSLPSVLFLFGRRGFPGQSFEPQSFVVFLEGFLLFFVFSDCLSLISS